MSFLNGFLYRYGIGALLLLIALEYACFPVSSEIVLPLAGALSSLWDTPFILILPLSVFSGLLGTSLCYAIGRFGGRKLLDRIVKKFPKTQKSIDKSFDFFERFGAKATCISRIIPLCRTYIGFVAGITKQNFLLFIISSAIGITFWNTVLIGMGFYLRENVGFVGELYRRYKYFVLAIILTVILVRFILKNNAKKRNNEQQNT